MADFQLEEKIKEFAKEKNISIRQLCIKIGMTENGFSKALKNNTLKLNVLKKISSELEVSIHDFFEDDNNDYYDEYENLDNQIKNLQTAIRKYAILGKALIDFSYDDIRNIVDYDFGELKEPISEDYYKRKDVLFKKNK